MRIWVTASGLLPREGRLAPKCRGYVSLIKSRSAGPSQSITVRKAALDETAAHSWELLRSDGIASRRIAAAHRAAPYGWVISSK